MEVKFPKLKRGDEPRLTPEQAREVFRYEDGKLYWRIKPANSIDPGDEAGTTDNRPSQRGRVTVCYRCNMYKRSRLIWMMHHGEIPKGLVIDHINNAPTNDRIENLQAITHQENCLKDARSGAQPTEVTEPLHSGCPIVMPLHS